MCVFRGSSAGSASRRDYRVRVRGPRTVVGGSFSQGRRERQTRPSVKLTYLIVPKVPKVRRHEGRGSQMHTRCLWCSAPDRQLAQSCTPAVTLTPRRVYPSRYSTPLGLDGTTGRAPLSHTHIYVLTLLSTLTTLHIYEPTRSKRRKLWGWLSCGCPCGIHGGIIQDMCTFWDLAYTLLNLRRSPRHST